MSSKIKIAVVCIIKILFVGCIQNSFSYEQQKLINDKATKLHDQGVELQRQHRLVNAMGYYQEALQLRDSILNNSTSFKEIELRDNILEGIIKGNYNLGVSNLKLGLFEKAEVYFKTCLNKLSAFEKDWRFASPNRKARAHHSLGQLYQITRGIEESSSEYRLALSQYLNEGNLKKAADVYNDLGAVFASWRLPDSTIFYSQQSITEYEGLGLYAKTALPNQNMGYAFILMRNHKEALNRLDKALYQYREADKSFEKSNTHAKILHNKALALRLKRSLKMALETIDTAIYINAFSVQTPSSYLSLAKNYSNKADIYLDQGDLANAKNYYERSIFQYGEQTKPQDFPAFVMPPPAKIIGDKIGFIEAVAGLAKTFAAGGDYEQAMSTYREALKYFDAFRKDLRDKPSKIQLAHLTKQIFEAAISLSYKTKPEQAFQFAESSKSYALLEAVRHYKAFEVAGIDSKLLKEENELRREIAYLAHQEINTDSVTYKAELHEKRDALQSRLDELLEQLEDNERYQQLMSAPVMSSLAEIQQSVLDEQQTLVEYFVGVDSTYIFSISGKQGLTIHAVPVNQEMVKDRVTKLVKAILPKKNETQRVLSKKTTAKTPLSSEQTYAQEASWFYQKLLAPAIPKPTTVPQRLIIIPDDLLGYVPFDGLYSDYHQDTLSYSKYRFVAEDYAISYCYSVSLLKEMQAQQKALAKDGLLLYTYPEKSFQRQRNHLSDIFTSQWDKNKGFIVDMDEDHPKKSLHEQSKNYCYVHFSTHGELNDVEPNLSFLRMRTASGEELLLYLYEIYNTRLNAEMVVTSACETGIGRFFNGEGIMSLARGFSYAGARSIVTTLWSVQEAETYEILNLFYQYLGEGIPKDLALYKAKKEYLLNNPSVELNPYYWSGIIPIGNMAGLSL